MCCFLTMKPESRARDHWVVDLLGSGTVRNEAYFY